MCMSERWRVHVLDVHNNLDRAVRYYPIDCSVMQVPALKRAAGGAAPSLPSFSSPHTTDNVSWGDGGLCFWTTTPGLGKSLTRCISIRLGPLMAPPMTSCRAWKRTSRSTLSSTTPSLNQTLYLVGNPRFSSEGSRGWMVRCWGFEKWKWTSAFTNVADSTSSPRRNSML